jgi:hypothetical protein
VIKRIIIISLIGILPVLSIAQVEFSGSLDLEVSKGGKDSQWIRNEIAYQYRDIHLAINQLNFFVSAQVSDAFFIDTRIQFDTWGTGKLNDPRVSLAVLSYEPEESSFSLSFGRYISPFGLFPQRILAADNSFNHWPLGYGYFVNISDVFGFWPGAGEGGVYGGEGDPGLTTIYFGGYNTGAMLNWVVVPEVFSIDLAIANAALASQRNYTNLQNIAGIVRLGFQPAIFWQQGISFSHGSFMQQQDTVYSYYDDFTEFTQTVIGTDLVIGYSYFELSGEIFYSMWSVPFFTGEDFVRDYYGKARAFSLANYAAYADLRYEPPFISGSYIAVRYDILRFVESDDLKSVNDWDYNPWDNDVTRYQIALGYKFAEPVLLKLTYMDQKTENVETDPEDYVYRAILTVSF